LRLNNILIQVIVLFVGIKIIKPKKKRRRRRRRRKMWFCPITKYVDPKRENKRFVSSYDLIYKKEKTSCYERDSSEGKCIQYEKQKVCLISHSLKGENRMLYMRAARGPIVRFL
jgi:hypothetical protein